MTMFLYQLHELNRTLLNPLITFSESGARMSSSPGELAVAAARRARAWQRTTSCCIGSARTTRSPSSTSLRSRHGHDIPIVEQIALEKPFCRLMRFKRFADDSDAVSQLQDRTDRAGRARRCPATTPRCCATPCARCCRTTRSTSPTGSTRAWCRSKHGAFHLDDYVDYIQEFIRHIGAKNLHVISVCQPTVPVLAAISLMASRGEDDAAHDDDDGRPDRHAQQPDLGQLARHARTRTNGSRTT